MIRTRFAPGARRPYEPPVMLSRRTHAAVLAAEIRRATPLRPAKPSWQPVVALMIIAVAALAAARYFGWVI